MGVGEIIGLILKFVPEIAKVIKELIDLFKGHKGGELKLTQEQADALHGHLEDLKAKVCRD